jgi:hypothetical protein
MLEKKRVTLPKLISFILSFSKENHKDADLDVVFDNIKSNDEFKFENLRYGETRNINDFSKQLKTIFDPFIKDFKRLGSRTNLPNINSNVSLFFSILSQVYPDFYKFGPDDQATNIIKLRDKLIIHLSADKIMDFYNYTALGWSKKDLTNSLVQFKSNKMVLKLLADYFNLNIFILNISDDKLYLLSANDHLNIFRQNVFVVFYNDVFEPLIYNNVSMLKYNSEPLKKLIHVDKGFIKLMSVNLNQDKKEESQNIKMLLEDLSKYVSENENVKNDKDNKQDIKSNETDKDNVELNNTEQNNTEMLEDNKYGEVYLEESDAHIDDIENADHDKKDHGKKNNIANKNKVFVENADSSNEKNEKNKIKFNISSKMKLEELQNIAKKLNVSIDKNLDSGKKKQKTKTELIEDLQKNL